MAQVKDLLVQGQTKFLRKAYFQDQIVSNVAQGTAPLVVASSTVVSNLNSDYLDGYHASGLFTALSANSTLSITIGGTTLTSSINAATVDGKYISNYYTKSEADDKFVNVAGDTMSGALIFSGVTGGNYNEGIRIQDASNKWAVITFGATGTTGCSPQPGEVAWVIAKEPGGKFLISPNTSYDTVGLRLEKDGNAYWRNNVILHAGNYTDYTVTKTGTGASGTWNINISGNADTVDNYHLASWIYPTSPRDFVDGTRIDTDIVYKNTNGDAFYMEIIGDTYFSLGSIYTIVQGYIYNDTIISYSVNNLGRVRLEHLYAMLIGDNLVFWFERLGYWQSYRIGIYKSSNGNYWENHCTSITNSAKPTGTKEIDLCVTVSGTVHTFNNAFLDSKVSGAESADSVPWSGITGKATSKTAWGQTFVDSSGNIQSISGNMTSVGQVTPDGNATRSNGTSSANWASVYSYALRSNDNLTLCSGTSKDIIFQTNAGTEHMRLLSGGTLVLKPGGASNYGEGIRINNADDGWTTLALGGSATAGTSAAVWSLHTYQNNFYLANNGASSFTNGIKCVGGVWSILSSGNVGIGTDSPGYKLQIAGDSYTTGWSRAANGFYVEGTGVHFTQQGGVGEIDMTSNNEFLWGSSSNTLYFNWRTVSRGTTVTNYIWNAGSSDSYASHTLGNLTSMGNQTLYGLTSTCNSGNSASYMQAAVQIREYNFGGAQSDTWGNAPRLAWHWAGRVQAQIGLASDNHLYISEDGSFSTPRLILHSGNSYVTGGKGVIAGTTITQVSNADYAQKLQVHDVRSAVRTPNYFDSYKLTSWFNNTGTPNGDWYSGIHVKGWSDGYTSWELCSYSSTGTSNDYDLYFRSGNNTTWGNWKTIITSGNIGSQSVNYSNYSGYATRLDGGAIAGWGTLTSSNGFSGIAAYDWEDKGAFCWAGKSGQMYMQVDGWFYQNEGQYRVLDTSDAGSLSVNYANYAGYLTAYTSSTGGTGTNKLYLWHDWNNTGSLGTYFHGIWVGSPDGNIGYDLAYLHGDKTHLYMRSYDYGTWNSWYKICTNADTYVASDGTNRGIIDGSEVASVRHLLINGVTWNSDWNWSGQSGQPSWLWGSNDGVNMYVWDPSNFSVNYANSAGNADTLDDYHIGDLDLRYTRTGWSFASPGDSSMTGSTDLQDWVTNMYNQGGYKGYSSITVGSWWWVRSLDFSSPVGTIRTSGAMIIYSGDGSSNKNYKHFLVLDAYAELYGITSNEESWKYYSRFLNNRNYTDFVYSKSTSDSRYLRKDTNDSTSCQYSFTKTDDHAIKVGTIRGTAVGSQTGDFIHLYERVAIGSPSGWGSRNAPSYGLATYGGAWLATDTGNVGIGTTSPSCKLHVNGSVYIGSTTLDNTAFTNSLQILANSSNESYDENFNENNQSFGITFVRDWSSGGYRTKQGGIYSVGSGNWRAGLAFRVKNNTTANGTHDITAMWISPVGNVGIGTSTPGYKLHVNGTSYLNGETIISNSIKILPTVWSELFNDYGLASDYTSRYNTEEFLKSWVKYAYAKGAGYTVMSYISPNARGYIVADVYASGINSSSGLPEHITGRYYQHGGDCIIFGTSYGTWYYRTGLDSGNYTSYVNNYYWANVKISTSSNTGTYPTFANMKSTGRVYLDEWIQFSGSSGLYWPNTNGAHLYANTTTSYAALITQGSRGGYCGLQCGPSANYMTVMSTDTHHGLYCENTGTWEFYYNRSNNSVGIRTSSNLGYDINLNGSVGSNSSISGVGFVHTSYNSASYLLTSNGGVVNESKYLKNFGSSNYVTFTVGGDANTYYPVRIHNPADYYPYSFITISRAYYETAPDTWYTSTHKGGLSMCLFWNSSSYWDGNSSGEECFCVRLNETYCNMVAGMDRILDGTVVWLRGGGATYHIHGMAGTSQGVTVYLESYTDGASRTFSPRTWEQRTPVSVRWPGYANGADYASSAGSVAWGNVTGKPFNWSGQSGQPTWLWGSNDGTNYYVWNPSNFNVNYANSAGSARQLTSLGNYTYSNLSTDIPTNAVSYKIVASGGAVLGDSQYNVLHIPWSSGDWGTYLLFGANNGRFGIKFKHTGDVRELPTILTTSSSNVTSLDCKKYSSIYVARSSTQTMTLSTTPNEGMECHIVIYNSGSSDITITLPSSYRKNVTSITIASGAFGEVNVMTINSIVHVRAV